MQSGSVDHVFRARVGDQDRTLYQFVGVNNPIGPEVVDDTFICLLGVRSRQGFDTWRILDTNGRRTSGLTARCSPPDRHSYPDLRVGLESAEGIRIPTWAEH